MPRAWSKERYGPLMKLDIIRIYEIRFTGSSPVGAFMNIRERFNKYGNKVRKHADVRLATYDIDLQSVLDAVEKLKASGFEVEDINLMADVEEDFGDSIAVLYVEASKELEGEELKQALKQIEEQEQQALKQREDADKELFLKLKEKYENPTK